MKSASFFFIMSTLSSSITATQCNRPETSNEYIFPIEKCSDESIRVISYNIRGESALDHEWGNVWDARKYKIQYLIQRYQPDIIGLQEVSARYIPDFLALLPEYRSIAFDIEKGNKDVVLLVRTSRFIIEKEGFFWLSDEPYTHDSLPHASWDARRPRIVVHALLHDQQTDKKCVIFCTHFDSTGVESRIKSTQVLMQRQKQIAAYLPVIIMGDFNLMITHPILKDIIKKTEDTYGLFINQTGLCDIRDFTGSAHYGPDGSWVGWPYDKYAVQSGMIGERLDHIFVRQSHVVQEGVLNVKVHDSLDSLVLPSENNYSDIMYASDHLPVIADIIVQ